MTTQNATGSAIERPAESAPGAARVVRVLALLALLLLTVTGCKIERIVWLVGDSTAQGDLLPALHHEGAIQHHDLVVPVAAIGGAALGRDGASFVERLRSANARGVPADAVVVSLGTNDLADGGQISGGVYVPPAWPHVDTPEERAAAIDALMEALPAVPVVWIVPHPPCHDAAPFAERESAIEGSLREAQARWPDLAILDAQRDWYEGSDADAVHFTREGERLAAVAIFDALEGVRP